jgi:arylsulfatase A
MKPILTFFLCFSMLAAFASAEEKQSKPNVVILLADDLGSKDLGCYGGPVKTPVLDNLASRGVKFTDFHAGAAVCSPSRATLLTGRQNLRTGIYSVLQDHMHDMHLLEREVTIAEVLQQAGYGTAHFGKWHVGMTSGKRKKPTLQQHGFDYWFGISNGANPSHKDPTNFMRNGKRVGPLKGYSCQLIVDDAIRWLDEKKNPDQPFFMNMWFNEPHSKLAAPDEITSIYGDLKDEAAIYSATVDNTDRAIGRLVAKLKETGKLDNTLIIYSSDHGSYRADRNGGLTGAKGSKFEGGLRSPGIFFWPNGFRGGRTEDTPSGSVDLLPTICGLTGIDKPKGVHLDGADLSPLLIEKGDLNRSQPLLWLSPSSGHLATLREGDYTLMGYSDYKLPANNAKKNELQQKLARLAGINPRAPNLGSRVTNTTFSSPEYNRLKSEFVRARTFQEAWIPTIKAGGFSRFELYDLKTDPQQKKDISKQRPKVTESLKKELLALYKDIMADAPDWSAQTGTENKQGKAKQNPEKGQRVQSSPQDILKKISQRPIPRGYRGSNHQSYVDERMKKLSPKQRTRLGELWKKASTEQNEGVNKGQLFVKILDYVQSSGKQHKSEDTLTRNDTFADSNYQFPREQKAFLEKTKRYWHQWRGPEATGMSATASPPVTWSEENNIRWKVPIEGQGNASPIVWDDKIFVLTAVDTKVVDPSLPPPEDQPERVFGITFPNTVFRFEVLCLNRFTGKKLWQQTATEKVPHEGTHHHADFSCASPVTEGERLYCWFGSAGMYCYSLDGTLLWKRDLGEVRVGASLGEGCSPVLHHGRIIIVRDHSGQSSIEVLEAATGQTVWKRTRDEKNAWATPQIFTEDGGRTQVITAASNFIRSYDLDTGEVIWQCSGLTGNVTPSPVIYNDMVICMSGYEGHSVMALKLNSKGDVSGSSAVVWSGDKGTPYIPSPLLFDDQLYFTQSNKGILTALNATTGEAIIERTRLPDIQNIYASPVGANGHVYFAGRTGAIVVLKHTNELNVVATNRLDDEFNASPVPVGDCLYLRGRQYLYCIGENKNN